MNTIQAGFDILVLLAAVDGTISRGEMEIIKQYVDDNFDGEFDINNETALLRSLDGQAKLRYFAEAAHTIRSDSTHPSREALILFALELIIKDGVLHPHERFLVNLLGEHWGMDTQALTQEFLDSHTLPQDDQLPE